MKSLKTLWSLLSVALLVALFAVGGSKVSAQVECMGKCEEQYAHCVQNGGSDPGVDCVGNYDACVDACLGGSGAILG
jgi:hypothetical protein